MNILWSMLRFGLLAVIFCALVAPLWAQQSPPDSLPATSPSDGGSTLGFFAAFPHKFAIGINSIAYADEIFYEYTGEVVYKEVKNPLYTSALFYEYFPRYSVPFIDMYSLGVDLHLIDFPADEFEKTQYSLEQRTTIRLQKQMATVSLQAYIEVFNQLLWLKFGFGVGYLQGTLSGSEYSFGRRIPYSAEFNSWQAHREVGVFLTSGRLSGGYSFRLFNAPEVGVATDHFNRLKGEEGEKKMSFSATLNTLYLSYIF